MSKGRKGSRYKVQNQAGCLQSPAAHSHQGTLGTSGEHAPQSYPAREVRKLRDLILLVHLMWTELALVVTERPSSDGTLLVLELEVGQAGMQRKN